MIKELSQEMNKEETKEKVLKNIYSNEYNFKYFVTLDYYYKCKDSSKVISDNRRLRTSTRRAYKDDIKMICFTEFHSDPDRNNYGGYHRHVLMTDASHSRWTEPTNIMSTHLLEVDPKSLFGIYEGIEPEEEIKIKVLKKIIRRFNNSVPNGHLALDIKPITDLNNLVRYCVKQIGQSNHANDVIDLANSDLNPEPLLV